MRIKCGEAVSPLADEWPLIKGFPLLFFLIPTNQDRAEVTLGTIPHKSCRHYIHLCALLSPSDAVKAPFVNITWQGAISDIKIMLFPLTSDMDL